VTGPPQLVALRPLGLGDLLTGLPALRGLRAAFPEHRLVLAAPSALAPLARLCGAVDDVVDTLPLRRLDPCLDDADIAVDLHGKGPESHRVIIAARPRRLLAFANAKVPETSRMPAWKADEHEVRRWCRLLVESGIHADPRALDLEAPARPTAVLAARGATVVHPGAASAARRWPPDRYAAVARAELRRGRPVVVTGGPHEVALAGAVASAAGLPGSAVLAGRTTLLDLGAVVASAGRVVCGDTGVAHLATAVRTPSVVLFGPTAPALWGPPPDRPWHRALWAGATGNPHGIEPDPGLLRLGVEDVLEALAELDALETAA
jgi:ADP-heptose:LPS heptosyltransferase